MSKAGCKPALRFYGVARRLVGKAESRNLESRNSDPVCQFLLAQFLLWFSSAFPSVML